jgi:hypothetical protein
MEHPVYRSVTLTNLNIMQQIAYKVISILQLIRQERIPAETVKKLLV